MEDDNDRVKMKHCVGVSSGECEDHRDCMLNVLPRPAAVNCSDLVALIRLLSRCHTRVLFLLPRLSALAFSTLVVSVHVRDLEVVETCGVAET